MTALERHLTVNTLTTPDVLARIQRQEEAPRVSTEEYTTLLEAINTLRGDVNNLLEIKSDVRRSSERKITDEHPVIHGAPTEVPGKGQNNTSVTEEDFKKFTPQSEEANKDFPTQDRLPTMAEIQAELERQQQKQAAIGRENSQQVGEDLRTDRERTRSKSERSKRTSVKTPRAGVSRSVSYDTTDTESSDSGDEGGYDIRTTIPFFQRVKGPKHPGLASLQPSNHRYDQLMSYRFYRLARREQQRDSIATTRLSRLLKNLDLTFKDKKFNGLDPVIIFDFLTRFVEECDMLDMTEAQAYVALPHYLLHPAHTQFRAMQNGAYSGGISSWPEAVQHLLRTYETPAAIRQATTALKDLVQKTDQSESAFAASLHQACLRCGNIHTEDEKMTFFVDGLSPGIRIAVARFREAEPRHQMTLDRLIQYAQDEGDTSRARADYERQLGATATTKPLKVAPRATRGSPLPRQADKKSQHVHFADLVQATAKALAESDASSGGQGQPSTSGDPILPMQEGDPDESIATSDLPSTIQLLQKIDQEALLYLSRSQNGNERGIGYRRPAPSSRGKSRTPIRHRPQAVPVGQI